MCARGSFTIHGVWNLFLQYTDRFGIGTNLVAFGSPALTFSAIIPTAIPSTEKTMAQGTRPYLSTYACVCVCVCVQQWMFSMPTRKIRSGTLARSRIRKID